MSLVCNNCKKRYTLSGFTFHGIRTTNPACREAYRHAIIEQLRSDVEDDSDTQSVMDDPQMFHFSDNVSIPDAAPDILAHSNGPDELGEKDNTLFVGNEGQDSDTASEGSDVDVDLDVNLLPLDTAADLCLPPHQAEQDPAPAPALAPAPPPEDERQMPRTTGLHVERFTRGRAGAVIEHLGVPTYTRYQNKLRDQNNIYEPFISKMDWEVARWAKLHSVSSSAVTDLLSIDGVRLSRS
jgi:hypothetical protein